MIKSLMSCTAIAGAALALAACSNDTPGAAQAPPSTEWHSMFDSGQATGCTQTGCTNLRSASPSPTPPPELTSKPEAKDFTVGLRTISKHCFGSAGCTTVVEPEISFISGNTLTSGYGCDITYTITGDESGEIVETATNAGGTSYTAHRTVVSTPGSKTKIGASVTSVNCRR